MLNAIAVICMLSVAYVGFREGLFTSFCTLVNIFLAGLVAFAFFEPIADLLEGVFKGGPVLGYEDYMALMGLFCITLILLRVVTNNLSNQVIEFPAKGQQFGGAAVGLLAGYFVSGVFLASLHTLPWQQDFLDYDVKQEAQTGLGLFPPDRAWLSLMRYAGAHGVAWHEDKPEAASRYDRFRTFDRAGTFEVRYLRYRRHSDRPPLPYNGELDEELGRKK